MKTNVIKGKIIEKYGTITNFANEVKWSPTKISRIQHGKQQMSAKDIKTAAAGLSISDPSEIVSLFL